jgi:hypothetical protein
MMTKNSKSGRKYYIATRPQTNGMHLIHTGGCPFMPEENKRIYLGTFLSGADASREGYRYYSASYPCRFCQKKKFKNEGSIETDKSIAPTREELSTCCVAILCLLN